MTFKNYKITVIREFEGQQIGIGQVDSGTWSHWYKDDGRDWQRVGPMFPSKMAVMTESKDYLKTNWGVE